MRFARALGSGALDALLAGSVLAGSVLAGSALAGRLLAGSVLAVGLLACGLDGRSLLLRRGEPCSNAEQCHSAHCVTSADSAAKVCCAEECTERCSGDGLSCIGSSMPGVGAPNASACLAPRDCNSERCADAPECALPNGAACRRDGDCRSGECEASLSGGTVCCETRCDGPCQRCSASGACDAAPASEPRCEAPTCPADSVCARYRPPEPGRCAAAGECAGCTAERQPAGRFCGPGAQCDATGTCAVTGVGSVAAGGQHTCILRGNGNVRCWGSNIAGELGARFDLLSVGRNERPVAVADLEIDFERTVLQLTAGIQHTCVLLARPTAPGAVPATAGAVRCWGSNEFWNEEHGGPSLAAVMGTPDVRVNELGRVEPKLTGDVHLPADAVQISADPFGMHTCAVLERGEVVCWGLNSEGQLGYGDTVNVGDQASEPLPMLALPGRALAVDAGGQHTCALLEGGSVTCWGLGRSGRLGYGGEASRLVPGEALELGGSARQVMASGSHSCALLDTGGVRCWGENNHGQLGYGHTTNIGDDPGETPAAAAELVTVTATAGMRPLGGDVALAGRSLQIEAHGSATCALLEGGSVRCFGVNAGGALGYAHDQNIGDQFTPEQAIVRTSNGVRAGGDLPLGGVPLALAGGGRCALLAEAKLRCWGDNRDGELGYGLPDLENTSRVTLSDLDFVPYE